MTLSKEAQTDRETIKRIKWIIEEFLENKQSAEAYEKNADLIRLHTARLEWSLKGTSFRDSVNDVYSVGKLLMYRSVLGNIWNFVKREIVSHRKREKFRTIIGDASPCISQKDKDMYRAFWGPATTLQSADVFMPPESNNIFMLSLKEGQLEFAKDRLEIVSKFMDLFQGVNLALLNICEAPNCDRWFVTSYSGTKKRRRACSNQHAARLYQSIKSAERKRDPKAALEYQHRRNKWKQERLKRQEAEGQ